MVWRRGNLMNAVFGQSERALVSAAYPSGLRFFTQAGISGRRMRRRLQEIADESGAEGRHCLGV